MSMFKISQPPTFDGKDRSTATVKTWAFSIKDYLELTDTDIAKRTRIASTYLEGIAKIWYITKYSETELPSLEGFLKAFKDYFLDGDSAVNAAHRIENDTQGKRTVAEYSQQFNLHLSEVSETSKNDVDWKRRHYLRGLNPDVHLAIAPHVVDVTDIDALTKKAMATEKAVQIAKALQATTMKMSPSTIRPSTIRPSMSSPSTAHHTGLSSESTTKRKKITDAERKYLDENHGCYFCRKLNAGHFSRDCPDLAKYLAKRALEEAKDGADFKVKKESVNTLSYIVESNSDSEPYSCSSVPTIKIATTIENTELPSSLVDCGATANLISSDIVEEHTISTHPTSPIRVHEPMNSKGVLVSKKVISKVGIPSESWESTKPAEFLVAPLREHDVILGMPFLATENVLIDPAHGKVILPPEVNGKEESDDEEDDGKFDGNQVTMRSICPKVVTLKPTPPKFDWIAALKTFDATLGNESSKPSSPTKNPISVTKATELNEKYIYEFSDVFSDKLPNKLPHPDAPRHRIVFDDNKMTVNGRMFRLPTRYWSKMMEFLEEHLKAGRIRPSSSHIASGTWMIPKEDPNVMPRVVHDYRAVNGNTVKDHTPLTRQDDIIEKLANAVVRGKIDLICAYYQILMEEADIHKIAFKTPFGLYEWLVMPQGLCNAVATFQRYRLRGQW